MLSQAQQVPLLHLVLRQTPFPLLLEAQGPAEAPAPHPNSSAASNTP